jgi:hypothetical protein
MPRSLVRYVNVVTPTLAFGGLLLGIRIGQPSWLDPPKPKPALLQVKDAILGYLDMRDGKPVLFARQGDQLDVSGWTACSVPGSTLRSVTILVGGEERGMVKDFFPRPDVARAFGRRDFEMSGWRTTIQLEGLKPGQYALTARGLGSCGEAGTLPAFRLVISE